MAKKPTKWNWTSAGLAMCHRCRDEYVGGKRDCGRLSCPLYSRMPYRKKDATPELGWLAINPKKEGIEKYDDQFDEPVGEYGVEIIIAPPNFPGPPRLPEEPELDWGDPEPVESVTDESVWQNETEEDPW